MDKGTFDALKAVLHPYFREGGTYANAVEAVRSAELDIEEEKRTATAEEGASLSERFPVTEEPTDG